MGDLMTQHVRNLFPSQPLLPAPEELIKRVQSNQYLEKTEEIYRMNLVSSKKALESVSKIMELKEPDAKGIAWAALGAIYTFNGNFRKAFGAFSIALDETVTSDAKAYIFTELSNLWRTLGYVKESLSILETSLNLTNNEKLKWRINTYIGLCHHESNNFELALSVLKQSAEHYRETRDYVRLDTVLRHMGLIQIDIGNFKEARKYFNEAMSIAVEHSLVEHQNDVMNDRGWMWIRQKEYDRARALFDKLILKELSPYQMSLALQNVGYIEYKRQNYREAIKFHSQSLQLTTRYEMRDMAFEDYYKLGLCHEKLGETGLADHFFSEGYRELVKEIDLGLPILGYRRKLLDAYVEFLSKNQQIPHVDVQSEIFGFAMDKSLWEIRDIFHKSLLSLHLGRTKNAPHLCRHLQIDTRTYFLYQKKLDLKRGVVKQSPLDRNLHFSHYLESLAPLTWKEANRKFEADLYDYLLGKYQYNKKKLAEVLGVSYQQVVQKTR